MGNEDLCRNSTDRDAYGLLFNIERIMKEKKKNYHTVLDYQKLEDEGALRYYSSLEHMRYKYLSREEIEEEAKNLPTATFASYFQQAFPIIETITDHYHDIITTDGRPDYRTIEILYLLTSILSILICLMDLLHIMVLE